MKRTVVKFVSVTKSMATAPGFRSLLGLFI